MTARPGAVLLDLDDTLVDHEGAARGAVLEFAAVHGPVGEPDALVQRWSDLTDRHYPRYQRRELSLDEHRRERVRAFVDRADLGDDEADLLFASYQRAYRERWRAHDDAAPALRALREAGVPLAVLTNGEQDIQTAKLRATGLLGLVDVVAASSHLPAAKPDPRAFTATADLLGVPVAGTVMVGDSLQNDVAGALAAGAAAVHLDRPGTTPRTAPRAGSPPPVAAAPRIRTLAALGGLLLVDG